MAFHRFQKINLKCFVKRKILKSLVRRRVFTILLLPILHLRLLPIHLPLRISFLIFTSHNTFKITLSLRHFKHLDSSNVVNLKQIMRIKHATCNLFGTNLPTQQCNFTCYSAVGRIFLRFSAQSFSGCFGLLFWFRA